MTFPIVLIAGIAGCYLIGSVMEGYAWRGSAQWSPEERQRITERLARFEGLLRVLDFAGIALIVVGLLRHYRMFTLPLTASRILIIAVAVLCLERVVRGWTTWRAFQEADQPEVKTRSLMAALASTVLQVALAAWVSWWVLTHVKVTPRGGGPATPTGQQGTGPWDETTGGGQTLPEQAPLWMTEAETLALLGKDKEYLDLLIPKMNIFGEPVRMEKDGRVFYHRKHFESYKRSGLPSLEELRLKRPQGEAPPPKPPEPLTEGDLLRE